MKEYEIKGNLCYYDEENPDNNLDCYDNEVERPKPRENCHCDNCFYGRDKLARYILAVLNLTNRTMNDTPTPRTIKSKQRKYDYKTNTRTDKLGCDALFAILKQSEYGME